MRDKSNTGLKTYPGDGGALTRWNFAPLDKWLRTGRSCKLSVWQSAFDWGNDLVYWIEGCPGCFTRELTMSSGAGSARFLESCNGLPVALNGDLINAW